jgi:hypothetical protein
MFKRKPVLKHESSLEEYPNIIVPAKTKIPEWYKKMSMHKCGKIINDDNPPRIDLTLKHCMPFLDSLTLGYMINLPYDLYVKNQNGEPYVCWKINDENAPRWRGLVASENLVPEGFTPVEYTWNMCVSFEVPKGYSILLTHPLNRYDLPFFTLTGVIEGGFTAYHNGNVPFYIRKGFEGIIEQGTPVAQIIPFRQETWTSKITKGLVEKAKLLSKKEKLALCGFYKKTFWKKKKYL